MRIIGGHDYYDAGMAYGQDRDVVFLRQKDKIIPSKQFYFYTGSLCCYGFQDEREKVIPIGWHDEVGPFRILHHIFLIAGKPYGMVKVEYLTKNNPPIFCWSMNQLDKALASEKVFRRLIPWTGSTRWRGKVLHDSDWSIFEPKIKPEQFNWLIDNRITIMHSYYKPGDTKYTFDWIVDAADLNQYEMAKRVDPYTLYQDIAMWVGGVLPRNPNPMIEITDDKVKLAKHGMDKTSFRKPKEQYQ